MGQVDGCNDFSVDVIVYGGQCNEWQSYNWWRDEGKGRGIKGIWFSGILTDSL